MAEELKEERCGCGGCGYGDMGYNNGYNNMGNCGGCGGSYYFDTCPEDCFVQILCELKGELIKVLTEGQCEGTIIGRLVSVARDFVNVSCDGSVAAIRLCKIVAIIPI